MLCMCNAVEVCRPKFFCPLIFPVPLTADGEVDETSAQEQFEDKMKEAIEGLSQKR